MTQRLCSQCGETTVPKDARSCFYKRAWVCSRACLHAAGDRTCCSGWECGCTKYAIKRRLLRQHRQQMRDMEDIIMLHGLYELYRREVTHYSYDTLFNMTCLFDLNDDPEMDEASDAVDPGQELRQEAADTRAFIEAMPGYLENRSLLTELERARMQLEDHYSERFRSMGHELIH